MGPLILFSLSGLSVLFSTGTSHAGGLIASDGVVDDSFGAAVSQSGNVGLVGASNKNVGGIPYRGAAYVYRNLHNATGTVIQAVKLTASDGALYDFFGSSVSLSGNVGLVGAFGKNAGANYQQGAAYVFRSLNTATGTVTQNAKLTASDGAASDQFGGSVSLSGNTGVVGAAWANTSQGTAYVYRNLNTATGTVTQNAKLTASVSAPDDFFGWSVSVSGNIGLIGTQSVNGAAYVFRNLDTVTGTVTENAKLTASDVVANGYYDNFGTSVSQSGNIGLVGAWGKIVGTNTWQGAAYVYRNLDTATGGVTENVRLLASDGAAYDSFGAAVSQSGNIALIGAGNDAVGANTDQGSAYIFLNLDSATGTVTQNVKLTASDGATSDYFGSSVSLSGDRFVIGAQNKNSGTGKAYSGSVSSVTTLDAGNISTTISAISFSSSENWVIGKTTDANQVTLGAGNSADVTAVGMTVAIGQLAGSDANILTLAGSLTANEVDIGTTGSIGNTLKLMSTASVNASAIKLAAQNYFSIQGDYTNINTLLSFLGDTSLQTKNGLNWQSVTAGNYSDQISSTYSSGFTTITTVPEPSSMVLALSAIGTLLIRRKR